MATATFREYVIWVQDMKGRWTCWKGGPKHCNKPRTFSKRRGRGGAEECGAVLLGGWPDKYKDAKVGPAIVIAKRPGT